MRRVPVGFILSMLFAFSVIAAPEVAAAQDMPPIFGTPDHPMAGVAAPTAPQQVSPSAQAAIPPAPAMAVKKPQVASVEHSAVVVRHPESLAEKRKFAALLKRLEQTRREAAAHRETVHRVVVYEPPPGPPGAIVPPPGYYPPGPYYQRLVYAGPYRGWAGFRGPYPYYDHP